MFNCFKRFPFIETNRYLLKAFKGDEFDTKGWLQNLKSLLEMFGLATLRQNIYKIINYKSFLRNKQQIYIFIFFTIILITPKIKDSLHV